MPNINNPDNSGGRPRTKTLFHSQKIFIGLYVLCAVVLAGVVREKFEPPALTPAATGPAPGVDSAKVQAALQAAGLPLHDALYWKEIQTP